MTKLPVLLPLLLISAAILAAVLLGRVSVWWKRLAAASVAIPFVLTLVDQILDAGPPPGLPGKVLVPAGEKPSPGGMQGYIVRVFAFRNGDFEQPARWVEGVVLPGGAWKLSLDLEGYPWVEVELGKPGDAEPRPWRGGEMHPVRCDVHDDGGGGGFQSAYEDLDGVTPLVPLAGALREAVRVSPGGWARLLLRRAEWAVRIVPAPFGSGGYREVDRVSWWAERAPALVDRCRAPTRLPTMGSRTAVPLLRLLGHRVSGLATFHAAVVVLILANGRRFPLRDASLLFLAWTILCLVAVRGGEGLHARRLASLDPEVRRRAVFSLLYEAPPTRAAVEAALPALWDPDRRVVYEALRGFPWSDDRIVSPSVSARLEELSGGNDPILVERASYALASRAARESRRKEIHVP